MPLQPWWKKNFQLPLALQAIMTEANQASTTTKLLFSTLSHSLSECRRRRADYLAGRQRRLHTAVLSDGIAGTVIIPRASTLALNPNQPTEGSGNPKSPMMKACQRMAIHPTMAIGGAEVQPKNATAAARVFCSQTKPEILAAIDVKTSFGDKIKGTGKFSNYFYKTYHHAGCTASIRRTLRLSTRLPGKLWRNRRFKQNALEDPRRLVWGACLDESMSG